MTKCRIVLIVLVCCLFTGCIPQTPTEHTVVLTISEIQQVTITPNPTQASSPTVPTAIIPQPTLLQTSTSTAVPESVIEYHNIVVETTIPPGSIIEGVLVMGGVFSKSGSFLLNLQSGEKTMLPEQRGVDLRFTSISPSRNLLAYFNLLDNGRYLEISEADGKPIFSYTCQENWYNIVGWLDNERLMIDTRPLENAT